MSGDSIVIEVDGQSRAIDQPFSVQEVLRLGGILSRGIVIRVDGGRASAFDPPGPVCFRAPARPVFLTFRGVAHRLHVDGLQWEWGLPFISESDVRTIGRISAHMKIRAEATGQVLKPGELIDLSVPRSPRFRSR